MFARDALLREKCDLLHVHCDLREFAAGNSLVECTDDDNIGVQVTFHHCAAATSVEEELNLPDAREWIQIRLLPVGHRFNRDRTTQP